MTSPHPRAALCALVFCAAFFASLTARGGWDTEHFLIRSWQSEEGLPSNNVRAIAQGADDYLWVATPEGVVRFDGIRFSGLGEEAEALLVKRRPRELFAQADGEVWISTARGGLLRWDGRRLTVVWEDVEAVVAATRFAAQVASDGAGGVYIDRGDEVFHVTKTGTPQRLEMSLEVAAKLRTAVDAQWQRRATAQPGLALEFRDHRGWLWTRTKTGGLTVADTPGQTEPVRLTQLPAGNNVVALMEDRQGNLWVGTAGNGLCQVRPRRVSVLSTAEGLSDRAALALLEDRAGALWVANRNGGLDRFVEGIKTHIDVGDGGANRPVSALYEDRAGTLWAATRGGAVFRWRDDSFRVATSTAMPVTKVMAMAEDADGRLWLGGEQGLAAWADGALARYGPAQGLSSQEVTALVLDAAGGIWTGASDGSLYLGGGRRFTKMGDCNGRSISSLLPEADGTVWVTTLGAGLFRWKDGRLDRFAAREGLPDARLTCLLDDGAGHLWLGSLAGIFRVAKTQLVEIAGRRRATAEWLHFDRLDGMLSRECTGNFQPAGWRSRDGVLRFPTLNGVATIQPATIEVNTTAPPVVIEDARAPGHFFVPGAKSLEVGPGRSRLEFRYTALSFSAPERVRFRTLLEGLNDEWSEVTTQRTAAYEAVPPGRYRFRVLAANGDGIWNEAGAALAVNIVPYFWETLWFEVAVGVFAVALAFAIGTVIARARWRGRMLRLEAQTSREKERARIAQDLHDDLGASLTEISLLAHLASEEKGRESTRDPLPEIATKAHDLVGVLDEIVWAANPRHDTVASLADYVAAFAAEFLGVAGIALRLDISSELPARPVTPERRHGLFLAVREALHNVVKHSGAREVKLRVGVEDGELKVSVEDNGHGVVTEATNLSEGLRNMPERMAGIGGTCRIESAASGTSVSFSLPLALS